MSPFPDRDRVELVQGTHVRLHFCHLSARTDHLPSNQVPSTETFSSDQVALGRAIEDIKAAWACQKHGVCFINKDATHVELNRFRLGAFGAAVVGLLFPMIIIFTDLFQVAGQCLASGPPPAELLQAWVGPTGLSTSVACYEFHFFLYCTTLLVHVTHVHCLVSFILLLSDSPRFYMTCSDSCGCATIMHDSYGLLMTRSLSCTDQ